LEKFPLEPSPQSLFDINNNTQTSPGMGGRENSGGREFKYDIFDIL
jgi:hypothetical protein